MKILCYFFLIGFVFSVFITLGIIVIVFCWPVAMVIVAVVTGAIVLITVVGLVTQLVPDKVTSSSSRSVTTIVLVSIEFDAVVSITETIK